MSVEKEELAGSTSSSSITSVENEGVDSTLVGIKDVSPALDDNANAVISDGDGIPKNEESSSVEAVAVGDLRFWVKREIKKLAEDTDMYLCQINGQRFFGPPFNDPARPGYGTEVFVAKVPRNCSEVDIFPLFRKVGPVYQIRMMLDFSGTNRGYCFVRFYDKSDAEKAIQELDGHEIWDGRCIGVVKSLDNCRLYISEIPVDKSNKEVREEIMRVSDGVTKVVMVGQEEDNFNKRVCLVSYETHRTASIARRSFLSGKNRLWGRPCVVEWGQSDVNDK